MNNLRKYDLLVQIRFYFPDMNAFSGGKSSSGFASSSAV